MCRPCLFILKAGLFSLVEFYNHDFKADSQKYFLRGKGDGDVESVEVALQYVDDISSRILPFANNIYNSEGGTHVTGFKTALTRTLNTYGRKNNLIKERRGQFHRRRCFGRV